MAREQSCTSILASKRSGRPAQLPAPYLLRLRLVRLLAEAAVHGGHLGLGHAQDLGQLLQPAEEGRGSGVSSGRRQVALDRINRQLAASCNIAGKAFSGPLHAQGNCLGIRRSDADP